MTPPPPTSLLPIVIGGSISALLYLYMALVSRSYGDATLVDAALVYAGAGLASVVLVCWLSRAWSDGDHANTADHATALLWLLAFAVLFRVLGVLGFPVLEDDIYRYLWDGWMFVETGTPYGTPPASIADAQLNERFADVLDRINYPEVATVYGPLLQLVFAAGYLVAPGAVWPLQCIAAAADIALLLLLLQLVGRHSKARLLCWVLYAWSPLLIKEFATTAHPDVIGALLVVLAWRAQRAGHWWLVGALLGLAVGVKPFALVIAPFLIGFNPRAIAGFGLAVIGLTVPFLAGSFGAGSFELHGFLQTTAGVWLPEGLRVMGSGWLFNAGLYEFALWLGVTNLDVLRALALASFGLVWGWQLWRTLWRGAGTRSLVWLFGLFLLVVPALNPWYLVWWLPMAVLRPSVTPWVASFAVLLSYVSGINLGLGSGLGLYEVPGWVLGLEFGSIGLAALFDWRSSKPANPASGAESAAR